MCCAASARPSVRARGIRPRGLCAMSCWVAPSVAAELWGVSVEHVLAGIREGTIASQIENGFVCVDAAPGSPHLSPKRGDHPPTFTIVTEDEIAALLGGCGED